MEVVLNYVTSILYILRGVGVSKISLFICGALL